VTFKSAVEETPDLKGTWCSGLQALPKTDRQHMDVADTGRLSGSINVEAALTKKCPDPRWDYAIGYRPGNVSGEVVYWVEIHPATSGEVKVVLAKLAWLQRWLRELAPRLHAMRKEFIWVSSGKTSFTLSSPQQKRFAQAGLQHKGRVFRIPDKAV